MDPSRKAAGWSEESRGFKHLGSWRHRDQLTGGRRDFVWRDRLSGVALHPVAETAQKKNLLARSPPLPNPGSTRVSNGPGPW